MPRSGGVYSKPAGTTAVASTTIESAKFNSVIDDLVTDANTARPIVAGGTGATSASAARAALGVAIGTDVQAYDALLADIAALTDPGADRLMFWDDSAGDIVWLEAGAGLSISGTTITATGVADGDKGDITVSSSGTVWSLDAGVVDTAELADDAVTLAKIADAVIVTEGEGIASNDNDTTIPTSAAVKDYVDSNAGSSTLLGTMTTTSGSSWSITSLDLTGYKFVRCVIDGVSASSTSSIMRFATNVQICIPSPTDVAQVSYGVFDIDLSDGTFAACVVPLNGSTPGNPTTGGGNSGVTTASTSIGVNFSTGTGDAGSIRFYGVF